MKIVNPIKVLTVCPFCRQQDEVTVGHQDYIAWKNDTVAQKAFPYLTVVQREQLITGVCDPCWTNRVGSKSD